MYNYAKSKNMKLIDFYDLCKGRESNVFVWTVIFKKTMWKEIKRAGNVKKVQRKCLIVYLSNVAGWTTCLWLGPTGFCAAEAAQYIQMSLVRPWKSAGHRTNGREQELKHVFWRSSNVYPCVLSQYDF